MNDDVVREIEEVSARAWPPLESATLDGWVLRAGGQVTGRANSIWPRLDRGALPLDDKLAQAAEFYRERDLPLLLQLSPTARPAGLAAELDARGYSIVRAARSVQVAPLDAAAELGDPALAAVSETLPAAWFEIVCAVNPSFASHPETARALLRGVSQPTAYAVATVEGQPAAVGRGVLDGPWLGIFNMATLPHLRRRGAAAAVLGALAGWAVDRGARQAYLQMEADTDAAPRLYAKAGFRHCYEYAFWGKPGHR